MAVQPSSANRIPLDKWKDGIDAAGRSMNTTGIEQQYLEYRKEYSNNSQKPAKP